MNNQTQGKTALEAIIHNYLETEKSLVSQLNCQMPNHYPTIGSFREEIWKQLFEQIVPKKYVIEQSVFLMDSEGNVSDEVDLAIFDEMYTPYIFRNGRIKFIPIEAVVAVVQCKSTNVENKVKSPDGCGKNVLEAWCDSINELQTSRKSITRMAEKIIVDSASTQSGTRPIKILCALKKPTSALVLQFDFTIIANGSSEKIDISIPHADDWTLSDWHNDLNMRDRRHSEKKLSYAEECDRKLADYQIEQNGKNVSLLSLNLQLNQLLMLINNPMLFPHIAYAERFRAVYGSMLEKDTPQK